ncbi:MAG: hypothetical protein ACI8PZ_004277 [Myxococcota bacterium]|jgi:hypothetical protein
MRWILAALLLPATATAAPGLAIHGDCGGPIDVEGWGFEPGKSRVAIMFSMAGEGAAVIPAGPCAGVVTGLASITHPGNAPAGYDGTLSFSPDIGGRACGAAMQLLEIDGCALTNVAWVGGVLDCDDGVIVEPPGLCPPACTGGCDGATCRIDCSRISACQTDRLICPEGLNCEVACNGMSSCQDAEIQCPSEGTCDISCGDTSACQSATIRGGSGGLALTCSATSTCQGGEVSCGDGPCEATCDGPASGLEVFDCGASCDCGTDCL